MKKSIILAAILAAYLTPALAGGGGGGSGGIVFDPTNFGKNTITAAKAIAMEARQAAQYATQLQRTALEIKQQVALAQDAVRAPFNDVMSTYRTVRQYQAALTGLQGAVADVQAMFDGRMRQMAASGLSMEQYIQREREMLKYRQDNNGILTAHERQVMDNAAQRYEQVRALQTQITGTEGTHQSMQLMNAQMNMLTASMQDLITLSAAEGNRVSTEAADRQAREQRTIDATEAYRQMRDKQREADWALVDRLKGASK